MDQYIDNDLYERSNNDIIVDLGARFKNYRMALRLTQKEVSRQSGVSVMTIVRFERGECTAMRLDNFVALMRAIQKLDGISGMIPEMRSAFIILLRNNNSGSGNETMKNNIVTVSLYEKEVCKLVWQGGYRNGFGKVVRSCHSTRNIINMA